MPGIGTFISAGRSLTVLAAYAARTERIGLPTADFDATLEAGAELI